MSFILHTWRIRGTAKTPRGKPPRTPREENRQDAKDAKGKTAKTPKGIQMRIVPGKEG